MKRSNLNAKRVLMALVAVITVGVGNAWGDTQSFSITDIDASHTEATKTPITVSIDGTVTTSSPQFRFNAPMTVYTTGAYKMTEISVTTNSTEAYISPLGATVSNGTWSKVSATNYKWSGDTRTVTLTPNSAVRITGITVTYYAITAKYTVTFNKGSGTCATSSLKENVAGGGVELPSATPPSDCAIKGWVLGGWKTTSAQTATTIEPTLYAAGSQYYPDADETLYAVYSLTEERTNCTAAKINTTAGLAVNDVVVMTYNGSNSKMQFGGLNVSNYGNAISYTSDLPEETHMLEVREGNSDGQYAFYDLTDKNYLSYSGGSNTLQIAGEVDENSSWTVSISDGVASIQNASVTTRYIKYNTSSPRFAGYLSDAGNTQFVSLYKFCPPIVTYNSNPDCTYDYFVDIMHDNVIDPVQGSYSMPAALSDASKGDDTYCDEKHYHFLGWVVEDDINDDGTLKAGATLCPAGQSGHTAANKTFYAIWASE